MPQVINEYLPDTVSPPRETLRELLEERCMSQAELAKRMGKTPKAISELLSDTDDVAITPETALQLEKAIGPSARFWLNRESAYREFRAKQEEKEENEKAIYWLDCLPLAELRKLGYVRAQRKGAEAVRESLAYFGVATVDSWWSLWSREEVSYRMSFAFESELGHLAAWLRHGEILAEKIRCADYDAKRFEASLAKVRELTTLPANELCTRLMNQCAAVGVAVVFVPEFPKTHVCGAARWIANGTRPLIYLSLRYRTDDHLWFTFFHEACHILRHAKKPIYIDDKEPDGTQFEEEANRFAQNHLIPPDLYDGLKRTCVSFYKDTIVQFARKIGIAPGIVVGRLQHDGLLSPKFHNDLKRRFDFEGLRLMEFQSTEFNGAARLVGKQH